MYIDIFKIWPKGGYMPLRSEKKHTVESLLFETALIGTNFHFLGFAL